MTRTLISNIGEFFTGDLASPMALASARLIEGGRVAAFDPAEDSAHDRELDMISELLPNRWTDWRRG